MWKPNNPILWRDIKRCPYHFTEEPRYSLWCRNDDRRLYKIKHSYLRWFWRLFAPGAWHPKNLYVSEFRNDTWI